MSIHVKRFIHLAILVGLVLLLAGPYKPASAARAETAVLKSLKPLAITTTKGTVLGGVSRMWVRDQSGISDNPLKYVLFKPSATIYDGFRGYALPATISPGDVTNIKIQVNYKGLAKASQTWTWYLFDWVQNKWVKVGDNSGALANVWKSLTFNVTLSPTRFVNNITRQIRLRLTSNNALGNAKLDHEAIVLTYNNACTDALGCVTIRPGDPIHIGYLLALTGPASNLAVEQRNAARLAIIDFGSKILGHPVKFDGKDGACNGTIALPAGQKLALDPSIVAIVGTTCSGEARAAMPVISQVGFSMVSPSNTWTGLTEPGNPNNLPGYLRTSWSDNVQGAIAAEYAWDHLSVTSAATIDDGSGYLTQAFANKFISLGGTIAAQKTIDPNGTDFNTILSEIAAVSPDMIYAPVYLPAGGFLISQARATTGLESVSLMGGDGLFTTEIGTAAGAASDGLLATAGPNAAKFSPLYASQFVPAYTLKYGSPPDPMGLSAYSYDAFMMIKAAIENVAVTQSPVGTLQIGRQALRDALYATTGFAGLTGTLTCSPTGDCADLSSAIALYEYDYPGNIFTKLWP